MERQRTSKSLTLEYIIFVSRQETSMVNFSKYCIHWRSWEVFDVVVLLWGERIVPESGEGLGGAPSQVQI